MRISPLLPAHPETANNKNVYILLSSPSTMKKGVSTLPAILSFLFSLPFVAAETVAEVWGRTAAGAVAGFLESARLNPETLATIMLGVLLWIIVFVIMRQIFNTDEGKGAILAGVAALAITLLSFLYLPESFLEAIALQYSAAGAALLAFIPLFIIFYFTAMVSRSLLLSRILWIFYVVFYFALFVYKVGTTQAGANPWYEYLPYLGAIIAGILIFFFLPKMRHIIFEGKLDSEEEHAIRDIKFRKLGRDLEREETEARTDFSGGSVA